MNKYKISRMEKILYTILGLSIGLRVADTTFQVIKENPDQIKYPILEHYDPKINDLATIIGGFAGAGAVGYTYGRRYQMKQNDQL